MKPVIKYLITFTVIAAVGTTVSMVASGRPDGVVIPEGCSKMVFSDEFNVPGSPDSTRWFFETGYVRNGEMQYYTDGANARCEDGLLIIEARNDSVVIDGNVCPVTSASLQSRHAWRYGYVEVRAKIPSFRGSWPAIWMMPQASVYGNWPRSGEIDIMEHVGYAPQNIHFAAHSQRYNHMRGVQRNHVEEAPEAVGSFHTYALRWTPERLTWIYDGRECFSLDREKNADWTSWPFDSDFYLLLNLAVGGGWGGQEGVDLTALPQRYEIDYVRIFQ